MPQPVIAPTLRGATGRPRKSAEAVHQILTHMRSRDVASVANVFPAHPWVIVWVDGKRRVVSLENQDVPLHSGTLRIDDVSGALDDAFSAAAKG